MKPDYYDEFQCIADKCSDNCCTGGWEIDIDEDTYNYCTVSVDPETKKVTMIDLDGQDLQ